tara:strand:+ start:31 stop:204 length:174 start_codon:yes stop_codon:yes gene_type:complete
VLEDEGDIPEVYFVIMIKTLFPVLLTYKFSLKPIANHNSKLDIPSNLASDLCYLYSP